MKWHKVPKSPSTLLRSPGRPKRETVSVRRFPAKSYNFLRRTLDFSGDLVTAERADVLSDGNGKLAIRFHEGGHFRVVKSMPSSHMRRIYLRKAAAILFPDDVSGPVKWEKKGDLIVIDTKQFEKP